MRKGGEGFRNVAPAVSAINIAGAQRTPLKVTELVEQEQRMVAGAAEVIIVSRSLLFAMGRTDAAVHVENDHLRWTAVMNTVDPCPAHVGQGSNVYISPESLSQNAPSGWRTQPIFRRPCHQQSTAWRDHVRDGRCRSGLQSTKATKHRLTELSRHAVPSVHTGTAVLENIPGNLSEAKSIVKLPISQQPGVRGDLGTMEFKLQAAVKIDPKAVPFRFTHRVCHANHSINTSTYEILAKNLHIRASKMAFRTALNCQSWRCSVVGEDKPLRNGVILYNYAEIEDYLGNVG